MYQELLPQEQENEKNGFLISTILHLLLLLLLFIPLIQSKVLNQEFSGIVVAIGIPDAGNLVNNNTESAASASAPEVVKESAETPSAAPTSEAKTEKTPQKNATPIVSVIQEESSEIKSTDKAEKITEKELSDAKAKAAAENAKKEKQAKELEALKAAQAAELAKQKAEAEAEAKRKAEAEKQKQLEESKSKFGSLFGQGSPGDKTENKGVENGSPDASILDGLSTGSGKAGDGLDARGIVFEPEIKDNSQKTGKVVVKVCVNNLGKVISANYTQKGSSTTDQYLVNLAEKNAAKYTFTPSDITEQCGTITINFLLK